MGILTVEQLVTADGFAADADGTLDFTDVVPFGDESATDSPQMHWLGTVDAILLGRLQLTDALLRAGLVEELRLRVVPVLIGSGRTFSSAETGALPLRLRDVERYDADHLTLTYSLDRERAV